jgi:hypothetical protein
MMMFHRAVVALAPQPPTVLFVIVAGLVFSCIVCPMLSTLFLCCATWLLPRDRSGRK